MDVVRALRQALALLRIVVALLIGIHGVTRITHGGVGGFGDFLATQHVPLGHVVAWAITSFEIGGALCLLLGRLVVFVAPVHILILVTGIVMVHRHHGWFVVGGGTGGMEYSVLLIAALAALFWAARGERLYRR
jgi:putative oxidoreductase